MLQSLAAVTVSSTRIWGISYLSMAFYLLLFPPMAFPQSYAVALGGGLLLLLFRPLPAESSQILGRAGWLFLTLLPVSAFWSLQPGVSLQSAGFTFLGALLYLMGRSNEPATQGRMEVGGLLLAAMAAVLALHQWLFGFGETQALLPRLTGMDFRVAEKAVYYHRASGPLVTPGALAALMALFLPLSFTLCALGRGFKRWFFGAVTLLLLLALLTAQSVGAFAALVLAGLAVLAFRKSWAGVLSVLAVGLAAVAGVIGSRGFQHWDISSFSGRVGLWDHAFHLFLKHPFFGSGLGTFGEAYQQAGYPLDSGASKYAHNLLLQLLAETGLVGTILFLAALFSLARRFKVPSRWEGWGAMTGILAFLLFSLVDLPFQMPELLWMFCLLAARLEFRPEKPLRLPVIPTAWVECGVLGVLLISGFWPPFRTWNMAMAACVLWAAMAFFQQKLENLPLWVFAGGVFVALRAFFSPSAMGAVWFFEVSGLVLAFGLLLKGLPDPRRFFKWFCGLGLVWALQVWRFSFQSSDIKDWHIFPNPKQVGTFLLALLFLRARSPLDLKPLSKGAKSFTDLLVLLYSAATMVCLRAFGAMVGLAAGTIALVKKQQRVAAALLGCLFIALVLAYRVTVFSSLDKNPTQWDRFLIWKAALQVWSMEPLEGVGPGAFAGLFDQVKSPRSSGVSRYLMDAEYAHNEFLEFLTAFGLVGLVWAFFLVKRLWPSKEPGRKAALAALGTASFFDFCFHTPLIALQGAGLLAQPANTKSKPCGTAAFLALGLGLSLFASAAFGPALKGQSEKLALGHQLPQALRCLEAAEKLNAWDSRYAVAKADYLERLYYSAPGYPAWKKLSDETFDRALELEQTDGQIRLNKAERLMRRLDYFSSESSQEDLQKTEDALKEAQSTMPFNAFVRQDESFFYGFGQVDKAIACQQKAVELEPNYAEAWERLGWLLYASHRYKEADEDFRKALEVYDRWKNEERIGDVEKKLVSLPPMEAELLEKETTP